MTDYSHLFWKTHWKIKPVVLSYTRILICIPMLWQRFLISWSKILYEKCSIQRVPILRYSLIFSKKLLIYPKCVLVIRISCYSRCVNKNYWIDYIDFEDAFSTITHKGVVHYGQRKLHQAFGRMQTGSLCAVVCWNENTLHPSPVQFSSDCM